MMSFNIPVLRRALLLFCLLLFGKLVEKNILFSSFDDRHARHVQKIFTEKERVLLLHADLLDEYIGNNTGDLEFTAFHSQYADELSNSGLYLFVYVNDTLNYWSSNDVAIPENFAASELNNPYVSLGNQLYASGKYASFVKHCSPQHTIVALMLIKRVYVYENKYLKTAFHHEFNLPPSVKIFPEQIAGYYPVIDSKGRFVWSLTFDRTNFYRYQIYVPAAAYLLAIIMLLFLLDGVLLMIPFAASRNRVLPVLALTLAIILLIMQRLQIPAVFYRMDVFTPVHFGSELFPSLGELCQWCIFTVFFAIELCRFLKFPVFDERRVWLYFGCVGTSFAAVIAGFFALSLLLRTLVINSTNMFEPPDRMLFFNGVSLLGYTVILLFIAAFGFLLDRVIQLCRQELNLLRYLIVYVIILSVVIIIWRIAGLPLHVVSVVFLTFTILVTGNRRLKHNARLRYSDHIILIFIFSLFVSFSINRYGYEKQIDQKRIMATNLASQHDLTAEFLLRTASAQIIADTKGMVDAVYKDFADNQSVAGTTDFSDLFAYIKRQHFYQSYWNRYIFRCQVCNDDWQLLVDHQQVTNCIDYFVDMTETMGTRLVRSEFWFIDRPGNVSSYLGWFRVKKDDEPPLQLFIELWPEPASDEEGYPELLLDDRLVQSNSMRGYSYAKYIHNRKMTQYGDFNYNLTGDVFQTEFTDYHTVYADGMEHLVYRPDADSMIVLSTKSTGLGDHLINFSSNFILFYIVVTLALIIFYMPSLRKFIQWNFRNRIQYSMIAIIIVSFAAIAVFTVMSVNRQYRNKNSDMLNEKMKAIHAELSSEIQTDADANNANNTTTIAEWLAAYQRLFFTDINLFDANGRLIGTSLPDVYDRGLLGRQINPDAYAALTRENRTSIILHEEIGGLQYTSAYEPFLDNQNRIIAFLNLPYFTQQNALTEEISNAVMTLINFYIVLILITVIVSIIISNHITQPLMLLQEKFRNIRLGENNESITYESRDEVGRLVKEYNRAIEELARSAKRLKRSERESAWREMAKQIAHEINNPLTPMKLSVQHLKRAYDNKSERFDEYMNKITHSLVEQIDNLSAIATEFSNFAKMPVARNERFNLFDQLSSVIPLYAVDENKRAFHTDFHGLDSAYIYADREQISRVFINLFKNAFQAIPKDRQAEIHIDILKINRMIWIRIKDNGMGIPDEMHEKMFRPNFTTKSSGMGVGLSIVHNIIESAGGSINFKTHIGEGTTFIISLPAAD